METSKFTRHLGQCAALAGVSVEMLQEDDLQQVVVNAYGMADTLTNVLTTADRVAVPADDIAAPFSC